MSRLFVCVLSGLVAVLAAPPLAAHAGHDTTLSPHHLGGIAVLAVLLGGAAWLVRRASQRRRQD